MSQEYLIKGKSLTAIADEIRELSGTTSKIGLDAMATHLSDANDEVNTQAELMAQIASLLETKAGGNAEMENTINVQASLIEEQSAKIAELYDILNNKLGVDDCFSITFASDSDAPFRIRYTDENGNAIDTNISSGYANKVTIKAYRGIVLMTHQYTNGFTYRFENYNEVVSNSIALSDCTMYFFKKDSTVNIAVMGDWA